jgi:hypothetical protein
MKILAALAFSHHSPDISNELAGALNSTLFVTYCHLLGL